MVLATTLWTMACGMYLSVLHDVLLVRSSFKYGLSNPFPSESIQIFVIFFRDCIIYQVSRKGQTFVSQPDKPMERCIALHVAAFPVSIWEHDLAAAVSEPRLANGFALDMQVSDLSLSLASSLDVLPVRHTRKFHRRRQD